MNPSNDPIINPEGRCSPSINPEGPLNPSRNALRLEFSKELFSAAETVSGLLFDAPWHSECRYVARQMAIDYMIQTFMGEACIVLRREGMDAARQVVGWNENVFCSRVHQVAAAIRPRLVAAGGWRTPVNNVPEPGPVEL